MDAMKDEGYPITQYRNTVKFNVPLCNSDTRLNSKKGVLKNRFISNLFMLVAFSSPVKFCKIVFPV